LVLGVVKNVFPSVHGCLESPVVKFPGSFVDCLSLDGFVSFNYLPQVALFHQSFVGELGVTALQLLHDLGLLVGVIVEVELFPLSEEAPHLIQVGLDDSVLDLGVHLLIVVMGGVLPLFEVREDLLG
jgi:hypothetical protein